MSDDAAISSRNAARPANSAHAPGSAIRRGDISFLADDGFALKGTLFEGSGTRPLVLISSATAVPRGLYAGFAEAVVRAGARAALIYDYRGTGGSSRPAGWKKRIGMKDWALLDLPAAARALDAVSPDHPMVGVGQSYGGQALGLSGIPGRFLRYGMVATMSGYWRGLDDRLAGPRMFLVGVPASLLFRDMPRRLGVGEPIPGSVFRDWARWCRMPDYFFDDPSLPETARYRDVRTPILAIGLTDDPWGTRRAVRALMRHYENAHVEERWLSPSDGGGQKIGHLGFFRSRFAETLWPQFAAWLLDGTPMTIGTTSDAQA
ncbi:alpha/beta hydrolase [Mesorhizobium sp. L-8-3]|nr:alpha/beta hydrolase [Mesorhizobium sp. L-8-3]